MFTGPLGMPLKPANIPVLLIRPRKAGEKTQRWLYEAIRGAIKDGRLKEGNRLPSTRRLAKEWDVARGTVVAVYDLLRADGCIEQRQGAGSFVSAAILNRSHHSARREEYRHTDAMLGPRQIIANSPFPISGDFTPRAFRPFQPDCEQFPCKTWGRLLSKAARATGAVLRYGEAAGYAPLREEVAAYLGNFRGVRCRPQQIVIVSGTQHGLELVARLLLARGDEVVVEDPLYSGAKAVFEGRGVKLRAIPVDRDGLETDKLRALEGISPRLVYVTPENQFPLGVAMSLERRFQLLEWAREKGAYIFEDDYDGEFRYCSRPLPSLQGMDDTHSVIYAGTFNKTMFPSLRLAYVVLPPALLDGVLHLRSLMDRFPPGIEQAALVHFIRDGHYSRHLRKMRAIYASRLRALREAASAHLPEAVLDEREAGLETIAWFAEGSDASRAEALKEAGIMAHPVSRYCLSRKLPPGLILGFGSIDEQSIDRGMRRLALISSSSKNGTNHRLRSPFGINDWLSLIPSLSREAIAAL